MNILKDSFGSALSCRGEMKTWCQRRDRMDGARLRRHPSPVKGSRPHDRTPDEIIMRQDSVCCSTRKTTATIQITLLRMMEMLFIPHDLIILGYRLQENGLNINTLPSDFTVIKMIEPVVDYSTYWVYWTKINKITRILKNKKHFNYIKSNMI